MKIETFINKEVKKYENKVLRNKENGINLDKLEKEFRNYYNNCIEFISKQDLSYSEECRLKDMANNGLQSVDDKIFGINVNGKCVGYSFYN